MMAEKAKDPDHYLPIDSETTALYAQLSIYQPSDDEIDRLASLIDEDSPEFQLVAEENARFLRELAEKYFD